MYSPMYIINYIAREESGKGRLYVYVALSSVTFGSVYNRHERCSRHPIFPMEAYSLNVVRCHEGKG